MNGGQSGGMMGGAGGGQGGGMSMGNRPAPGGVLGGGGSGGIPFGSPPPAGIPPDVWQSMQSQAQQRGFSGVGPGASLNMSPQQRQQALGAPPQGLMGFGGSMGGAMGKPFGKEDNGSPPPDIYNPGVTNVPGNYGNPANNGTPPPPQTPLPGAPPAPQQSGNIPYSAQSYNQPFSPFQNFDQQAQSAFNPMPQTSVGSYGRWDPMTWQGIAGPWPQLFGGPGAPAQHSMGTAQNNGMTAPQQALNAQMQRWYGGR